MEFLENLRKGDFVDKAFYLLGTGWIMVWFLFPKYNWHYILFTLVIGLILVAYKRLIKK